MRKFVLPLLTIIVASLSSCGDPVQETEAAVSAAGPIELDGAKAAEVLASDPAIIILDIRTPEEFAEGHIKGAINVDFTADDFESKLADLDRDQPYLVHCASGGRSGTSLPVFEKLEFNRLYHLKTGFSGWVADGQPVEK